MPSWMRQLPPRGSVAAGDKQKEGGVNMDDDAVKLGRLSLSVDPSKLYRLVAPKLDDTPGAAAAVASASAGGRILPKFDNAPFSLYPFLERKK